MASAFVVQAGLDSTAQLAPAPTIALAMVCARTSLATAILDSVVMTAAHCNAQMTARVKELVTTAPAIVKVHSVELIVPSRPAPTTAPMPDFATTESATATQDLREKIAPPKCAPTAARVMVSAQLTTSLASASLDGPVMIAH